jgi:sulfatase modifying factor 1
LRPLAIREQAANGCRIFGRTLCILQPFQIGPFDLIEEGPIAMAAPSKFVSSSVFIVSVFLLGVAACASHAETGAGAEGPKRPVAAPIPTEVADSTHARMPPDALHPEPLPSPVEAPVAAPAPSSSSACGEGMVLVEGEYCTEVRQICEDWMESPNATSNARCRKFAPSECIGTRVHKRFCIDKDEYTAKGETLPTSNTSWTQAKATCEGDGKRLCQESEWNFACEGEDMNAYATGSQRDSKSCNYDQMSLLDHYGKLLDLRKTSSDTEQCVSAFGVRNMNGNVDEWTFRDVTNGEWRSAMKGGWWMAARNRCRPATTAHDEHFKGFQAGFRCCSDAR